MRRIATQIRFARHVTPGKLAARIGLQLKRRLFQKLRRGETAPALARHDLRIAANPPLPVFAPRQSATALGDGAFELSFLNSARRFRQPFEWHPPELDHGTRLWKLNLHYHEFLETLSDEDFLAVASDWIGNNQRFRRTYWMDSWNSYALSIRVVVWMQQIARRGLARDRTVKEFLLPSLVAQMRFLIANLETDIGGNHLMKNIKALIWAGPFLEGREAERFAERGIALLRNELDQVLPDGMHYERSASYHAQVFADLLEIRHALGGDPLGGRLDATLDRMEQALDALTHPDGGPALFNDAGLTMAYSPNECRDAYALVVGKKRPHSQPTGSFALEAAGYYGFRSAGPYVVIDCGKIAPDDLPAHGHGDVLSIELSWAGKRFIVDQGVFEYSAGWRRHASRSAASHNTLCFAEADQAEFFGSFRVGQRPNPRMESWSGNADGCSFSGFLDGFVGMPPPVGHRRELEAGPDIVMVRDTVIGDADRPAFVRWLLHPDVRVSHTAGAIRLRRDGISLTLSLDCPFCVEPAVWWPDMGSEIATKRIVARLEPGTRQAKFIFRRDSGKHWE